MSFSPFFLKTKVAHLLGLGADASAATANQWTAAHFAQQFGHSSIVEMLQQHE